jgi:hypothetical protein
LRDFITRLASWQGLAAADAMLAGEPIFAPIPGPLAMVAMVAVVSDVEQGLA